MAPQRSTLSDMTMTQKIKTRPSFVTRTQQLELKGGESPKTRISLAFMSDFVMDHLMLPECLSEGLAAVSKSADISQRLWANKS